MFHLNFELQKLPDLELVKYQSLGDQGVEGVIERHNAFLRQWQRISHISDTGMHLYIAFYPNDTLGERVKICFSLSYNDESLTEKYRALIRVSPLSQFFILEESDVLFERIKASSYSSEAILKKEERKKTSIAAENEQSAPTFFTVEGWEANDTSRLFDMIRVMTALNTEVVYCADLYGTEAFDNMSRSLEKPIAYLRKRTLDRFNQLVSFSDSKKSAPRDIAAEETLKNYEEVLTRVADSPCFRANIRCLSNDKGTAHIVLDAACGESISKGDCEVKLIDGNVHSAVNEENKAKDYYNILPESLSYWPTLFTLEEISPYFRFPALYDGETIELPKETMPGKISDGLHVGLDSEKHDVFLPVNMFKKHAFVCGVPGAGKTNTMLHLCYSLWNNYRIPFLVLEPAKKEYRALAQTDIKELIVFSPSTGSKFPMAINPFQFPLGMALAEHIQNLMNVFEGAFPLSPPLPALLDRAIEGVYAEHGWDTEDLNDGSKIYPTMSELYKRLETELEMTDYDGEVRGNMKSALEMRIGSLLRRDLGNVFDVPVSTLSPESLLKYPVIIELESLGTGPSNFMTLMLCTLIREVLRINPLGDPEKSVRHVIFIEEAHNLISPQSAEVSGEDADPKIAATNYIVKMLAEVRALREGIVIADQLPTAMAPEVLKNTGIKIAHRITAEDDRGLIGSTMSATGVQLEELATFIPGKTLLSYEGLMKPFKMRVDMFELKDPPSTEELYELMSRRELHTAAMNATIQTRMYKLSDKFAAEMRVANKQHELLKKACAEAKDDADVSDMKDIVRIQLGMSNTLKEMQSIVKKYKRQAEFFNVVNEESVNELKGMISSIENVRNNVRETIKSV